MKLNLLFAVMYFFTMLAYPFVFLHGKLHRFLKPRSLLVTDAVTPGE
jgi:hypothetical protein